MCVMVPYYTPGREKLFHVVFEHSGRHSEDSDCTVQSPLYTDSNIYYAQLGSGVITDLYSEGHHYSLRLS